MNTPGGDPVKKRRTVEDFQADMRQRKAAEPHTTPGDEERKEAIKRRGLDALRRIHRNQVWEDWMEVGEALLIITEEAMAEVGVESWSGDDKKLVKAFNTRWDAYEQLASNDPNHKPLSKQERWALREVMTKPEIGAWRATQTGPKRRKLNHPNAVINGWKRTQPRPPSKPRQPSNLLSPALQERDEEIAQLKAQIEEGPGLTLDQHIDAVVELLNAKPLPERMQIVQELAARIGIAARRSRGRRKSKQPDVLKQVEDDLNAALGGLGEKD
jgi:hypothetical protein